MQRDRIDFGSMNIPVLFRKIFFPTLLGMVCMACITIADGIFVGVAWEATRWPPSISSPRFYGDDRDRAALRGGIVGRGFRPPVAKKSEGGQPLILHKRCWCPSC